MEENDKLRIIFHHVPNCEDYVFEPHWSIHRLATSTKIECSHSALRSIAFSRKQITDDIMSDWSNRFRLSQYVGQFFMYPRWLANRLCHNRAKCKDPSHLNGGTWLKDTGHSLSLTSQMACGLTSHAPIGHYRHRFNVGNKCEEYPHCEGGPPETFHHVLYKCLKHPTRPPDMPTYSEETPYWDFFGEFIMDNPGAYAFMDSHYHSQTVANSTRRVGCWAKGAPAKARSRRTKAGDGNISAPGRALPRGTVPIGHILHESGIYGRISHWLAVLMTAHINVFVLHKSTNPRVRSNSRKFGTFFQPIRDQ